MFGDVFYNSVINFHHSHMCKIPLFIGLSVNYETFIAH